MENITNKNALLQHLMTVIDDQIEIARIDNLSESGITDDSASHSVEDRLSELERTTSDFDKDDFLTEYDIEDFLINDDLEDLNNLTSKLEKRIDKDSDQISELEEWRINFCEGHDLVIESLIDEKVNAALEGLNITKLGEMIDRQVDVRFQQLAKTLRQNLLHALDFDS
tara:strand:+ start:316 stop:822 length:507 start_codon:yes stop_codon:yes gene_type:complete